MVSILIAGGGASGCAAALSAAASGADVVLVERTDLLMTGALRAGRMNTNGKFIATEESKALGGGALFEGLESIEIHRGAELPGEEFTYVYDCASVEAVARELLKNAGIEVIFEQRVREVELSERTVSAVILDNGAKYESSVYVDATGTSGGLDICTQHGKGCVECIYRCPTFGDRISLVGAVGLSERARIRPDGRIGAIGSGATLHKQSLHPDTLAELEKTGELTIPLPPDLVDESRAKKSTASRTARQMHFLNVTDIGVAAKLTGLSYMPLTDLRRIPGFEQAQYESPLAGGRYNRISRVAISNWLADLSVDGVSNVFCAGEKLGISGVCEAIATGNIAGHNAVRLAVGVEPLVLPRTTGLGEYLAWVNTRINEPGGTSSGYSLSNGESVDNMRALGFYGGDAAPMHARVAAAGLSGVFGRRVVPPTS